MTDARIIECAKALCVARGYDPEIVAAINPAPAGSPAADVAVPMWTRFVAQAIAVVSIWLKQPPTDAMVLAAMRAGSEEIPGAFYQGACAQAVKEIAGS